MGTKAKNLAEWHVSIFGVGYVNYKYSAPKGLNRLAKTDPIFTIASFLVTNYFWLLWLERIITTLLYSAHLEVSQCFKIWFSMANLSSGTSSHTHLQGQKDKICIDICIQNIYTLIQLITNKIEIAKYYLIVSTISFVPSFSS